MNACNGDAKSRFRRIGVLLLSFCMAISLLPAAAWATSGSDASEKPAIYAALASVTPDTSWYTSNTSATTFTISNAAGLAGLSDLVNNQSVNFSGKTVQLTQNINGGGNTIKPIGVGSTSFNGTFDGGGNTISNLVIDASSNTNIGIFGKTGSGSVLKNVNVGSNVSISINRSSKTDPVISSVGLLVGRCEGSLENCSSAGSITITTAAEQKSATECLVVNQVGGIAGVCYKDVKSCTFSGKISITATAAPTTAYDSPAIVGIIGGVVGFEGDVTQYGKTSTADSHGKVENCVNSGNISVETPSTAGIDRFGEAVSAKSREVGGVAGYSRGSVISCTNNGYVRAPNAEMAGGIVGTLRSVEAEGNSNYSSIGGDEGSSADPIEASKCVNTGIVYAHAALGGIAGQSGTYVTIKGCVNVADAFVVGTRWNKPSPGGIVGHAYGTVCYCANLGSVASGTWDNENLHTIKTMSGYYAGGIAGMILHYNGKDSAGNSVRVSPVSEVYNCYNAGQIIVQAGFRSRNIVGNNEGYVHDNAALTGMCDDDQCTYGELNETDAAGVAHDNLVCAAISGYSQTAEKSLAGDGTMTYKYRVLKDGKEDWATGTKESSLVHLNSFASGNSFETYWVYNSDKSVNKGYPILNWQAEILSVTKTSISGATLSRSENAKYNGGEAIPKVAVTLAGKKLLQNVDYQVVPQSGATEVTSGSTSYRATVKGIGLYSGTSSSSVAYGIDKGDLSTCSAVVDPKVFNWKAQVPDTVIVKDSTGNVVAGSEYTYSLTKEAINADQYDLVITAKSSSTHFEGSLNTLFRIEAADFKEKVDIESSGAKIRYMGKEYAWTKEQNSITETNPESIPVFEYTGHPIHPEVLNVTYLEQPLVEGRDYTVVYGSLGNSESGSALIEVSEDNVGKKGQTTYGAVMVRFVVGSNFANYDNMLIKIADTGAKLKLSDAVVDAPDVIYENQPMNTVSLTYGGAKLDEGVDYEITYKNNNAPGTAQYTITGIGKFEGTLTGSFKITDDSMFDFTFDIVSEGTTKSASITGFKYNGMYDTFNLVIPSTVQKDGVSYPVTSIAANAFGGESSADFTGTDKLRIKSAYIPASVTTIGKYAFGTASSSVEPILTSVTFEEGSKLTTIEEGAFKRCKGLTSFTFPENVATIGEKAFDTCTGLSKLIFLTTSATLPSSVASTSFTAVGGTSRPVSVLGYEPALAVKQLAQDNSTKATVGAGTNGGKNFSFAIYTGEEASGDIQVMYRLYNPNSGEHFYTASEGERNHLIGLGWDDEGTGWIAPTTGDPVYRLYNPNAGEHHYTMNALEKDNLVNVGWQYESVGWYSGGDVRLYREYNPNAYANNHNYTTNKVEHDWLLSLGWNDEGYAWNAVAVG